MSGIRVLDAADRLLISTDDGLVELDTTGRATPLGPAGGEARYLPGTRDVVYQDGPALMLRERGRTRRLVSADHAVELLGVLPGRVVYRANPRHRLLWDVMIRNVFVGEEQAVYTRGGDVRSASVSPNSRHIAIRLPRKLVLVDTMPVTEDDHVRLICPEPADGGHHHLSWLPDSARMIANADGEVSRYDVERDTWEPLVTGLTPDAVAVAAPDGRRLAVVDDGRVSFHHAGTGDFLRAAELDAHGAPVWTPDSTTVAVATADGAATVVAQSAFVRAIPL
ncbi:hypothetical protein [Actinokineospora sp. UTMC 2448]|uniref:hypothetical protein n=1 Tax=Actinokineospora sp. UTMC 2448 TaxID=2268449 RepID=UPI0021646F66|nr:hypothetical protein [Actinokineospora sp. UTMC 2448]UVS76541.1 hypothetical protein Actkin_00233 [Actinokineospora sp. UTMC 2448]